MDTKKIRPVESGNDAKREKVRVIPIQFFDDFPGHPFYVKMDEEMKALMESIKKFGILTPLIARKKENDRYEIIAGHRRKFAAKKLGLPELPVILRDMTRDEAIVAMVDSNLHRERILPSEKAYAYTAYYKNEYCFNHYTIYVEEVELSLSVPFAEQMLPVCLGMKYREDVVEQIMPWEITEEARKTSLNDPNLYAMVASSLQKNERYQEEYAEVIAEVARKLTRQHLKIADVLKKAQNKVK